MSVRPGSQRPWDRRQVFTHRHDSSFFCGVWFCAVVSSRQCENRNGSSFVVWFSASTLFPPPCSANLLFSILSSPFSLPGAVTIRRNFLRLLEASTLVLYPGLLYPGHLSVLGIMVFIPILKPEVDCVGLEDWKSVNSWRKE